MKLRGNVSSTVNVQHLYLQRPASEALDAISLLLHSQLSYWYHITQGLPQEIPGSWSTAVRSTAGSVQVIEPGFEEFKLQNSI